MIDANDFPKAPVYTRKQIEEMIEHHKFEMEVHRYHMQELFKEWMMLSDDELTYKETTEMSFKRAGRKMVKEPYERGGVYWIEHVKDGDTGKTFPLERSMTVKVNGEWVNDFEQCFSALSGI
jgi:hypothetical protein